MSVLIKGMEMPTNCRECPVALNGKYCRITKSHTTYIVLKARPENCPLIEIPVPHGRLVEAGAVVKKANHEAEAMSGSLKEYFGQLVEWIVDKTPGVIEAEDEE